jgi:hypothetical protein
MLALPNAIIAADKAIPEEACDVSSVSILLRRFGCGSAGVGLAVLRFRSSQIFAATCDANFGIKGAPAS